MADEKKVKIGGTANFSPCACSRFSVLVNERQVEEGGDIVFDEEWTTGCPGTKTKSTFLPGHDAKLKSLMIRAGVANEAVREDDGSLAAYADPITMASHFGFASMVKAGIERGLEKAAAKKAPRKTAAKKTAANKPLKDVVAQEEAKHQAETAAVQKAREAGADWSDPEAKPARVWAKVGRWEYEGTVNEKSQAFHYISNSGDKKVAKLGKYSIVEK